MKKSEKQEKEKKMLKETIIAKGPIRMDSKKEYYMLQTISWGTVRGKSYGECTIGTVPLGSWAKDYLDKVLVISLIENVPENGE